MYTTCSYIIYTSRWVLVWGGIFSMEAALAPAAPGWVADTTSGSAARLSGSTALAELRNTAPPSLNTNYFKTYNKDISVTVRRFSFLFS